MSNSARSINDVIRELEFIVQDCRDREDPRGYFASLYLQVTTRVKEGIAAHFFEDGPRMERLDVVFAQRYLDAYHAYDKKDPLTNSWRLTFDSAQRYWPIVLQHLLLGINAHINLDLGIAAVEVSRGEQLPRLREDFNRINQILAELVNQVEADLIAIWPRLGKLIKWLDGSENLLLDFSMLLARDGAWKFAETLNGIPDEEWAATIALRDQKIEKLGQGITSRKWYLRLLFNAIRLGERGSVRDKIDQLSGTTLV